VAASFTSMLATTNYGVATASIFTPHVVVQGASYWIQVKHLATGGLPTNTFMTVTAVGYQAGSP
jgi:hypothetical protein